MGKKGGVSQCGGHHRPPRFCRSFRVRDLGPQVSDLFDPIVIVFFVAVPEGLEAKESILGEVGGNGEAHHIVAITQVAKKPLV